MVQVLYDPTQLHPGELTGILTAETELNGIINDHPIRWRKYKVPYEKIELYADNDRTLRVFIKDGDLNIIDLTGATLVLTVKETKSSTSTIFTKSTANPSEGQIGAADEGEAFFFIVPADTSSLDIRQYVYDVEVTLANGKKYTTLEGIIDLLQSVG